MTEPFPPPGYIQGESKLEGIEIYQPAPPAEKHQEIVDFKCPQCGATTAYSLEDGGLTCTYCNYYESPKSVAVGKRADEFEFKVETLERAAQGWGEARKELSCQRCGAAVSLPPESLTVTCPFCGSNKVIQRQAPQDILRPRYLVPFKIEPHACRAAVQTWLGSSWMTPASLQQVSRVGDFTPIYIPFWTFDSACKAGWKAQVGHEVTERYYQDGEWKTRTRIDWRWESGHVQASYDDVLINGTQKLSPVLLERISNFNLSALTPYEPRFLAGLQAQAYDIPLETAWEQGREVMRERTRQACRSQASTSLVRNFSMSLDFSEESWRYILLPLFISVYQYESNAYQIMVNGQSGAVSGQRPADWNKVWLVIAACLAPGLLLGLLGLVTLPFGGLGVIPAGLGFFLLIIGLIIAFVIYRKAQELDDA
jgi:DNA-directed RNA polymerase subunit RPC12/RpoP